MVAYKRRVKNIVVIPTTELERTSVYFEAELRHRLKIAACELSLACNQNLSFSKIVNDLIAEYLDVFVEAYKVKHAEAIRKNKEGIDERLG